MRELVELSSLELRYEGYRLRDDAREARVLASIAEQGIEQPLEGVDTPEGRFLLNGFKRVRSAQKLGLDSVPYVSLGEEEALGILSLMRATTDQTLSLLEQARFIGDLYSLQRSLQRVMLKCQDPRLQSRAFFAQANLLAGGLLSQLEPFRERMREFYDRSGHAEGFYQMHLAGMAQRQISRQFQISRHTVREIIRQQGVRLPRVRKDKICVEEELLQRLYRECHGWLQRVHEKLVEEEGIQISYPTLTRLARELGLGQPPSTRCQHVPDEPGAEMQHDTTVYQVRLGDQLTRLIASLLYLRYCKARYLKFYRLFNRFAMKCFLHEALMFRGSAAKQCIIDNTNLARLRGSGKRAIIVPEMAAFAERYGCQFVCHAIGHPNRKAGEERSFWTVETNFLPGRTFTSLEDLNRQALEWATVRLHHRPVSKTGLIPAKAFEHERSYLTELSPHLPAPYEEQPRGTDEYGYISRGTITGCRAASGRTSRSCSTRTA